MLALADRAGGVADRHAVLDDVFARRDVAERVFVSVVTDFDGVKGMDDHWRAPGVNETYIILPKSRSRFVLQKCGGLW